MNFTAVLLYKGAGEHKTRLSGRLDAVARERLSARLFAHVAGVLFDSPGLADVALLSDVCPAGWRGRFLRDAGRGMNAELAAVGAVLGGPMLVVHADLPFVEVGDIAAMIEAGDAVAPDRHGSGTNALALVSPRGFGFAFGAGSFAKHRIAAPGARIVERVGLRFDIDTVEDLDAAVGLGFVVG
jgi:2-phospho-L-lactate guanylyltransferase